MTRPYIQAQPRAGATQGDSTATRKLLAERLAYIGLLLGTASVAFWLLEIGADVLGGNAFFDQYLLAAVFHAVGFSSMLGLWLYARGGNRSFTALRMADAAAMLVSALAYVTMATWLPIGSEPESLIILINTLSLLCRSIWVPSTARRTAAIGVPMGLIIITGLTLISYRNFDASLYAAGTAPALQTRADFARQTFFGASLWWSIIVFTCTSASKVIHGLRREVRDFRELGQYTLEARLGQGGMGTVYRARHAMLRRPTAIKLLRPERSGELDLARFEQEVQLTAQLSHPNIVTVFDYGRTPEGTFYYAMEYLHGASVAELVAHSGPQPPARVARIMREVAGALAAAHAKGLIHRDIKPANIMLCEYGGTMGIAKVVDFGLVRPVAQSELGDDLPADDAHVIVGTPGFMAPEVFLQPSEADPRSDLYALGAVGYYMLTGTQVFDGKTMMQVCNKHMHDEPEPPSRRLGKPLPAALEALVLACLEKKPDRRPQSAKELCLWLDALSDLGDWDEDAWWAGAGQALLARHANGAVTHADNALPDGHASTVAALAGAGDVGLAPASAPTIAVDLRHRN